MKKLVVVTGQTATGKTEYAVRLAKELNGELINCDSRQVYKYLDIVTGKDLNIIKDIPIHLYSIIDPKEQFSSYKWSKLALRCIDTLKRKNKTSIVIGGAYHYIKHLLYGIETEGIRPDLKLRKNLRKTSVKELQKILSRLSNRLKIGLGMNESDWNNPRRLIRKIEILSHDNSISQKPINYKLPTINYKLIGFRHKSKESLIKAISKRVEKRLKQGAIKEVRDLLRNGYKETDPGLQTIGCKQIVKYLKGRMSKEDAIKEWITKEVQYAKRQYTFMKKDRNASWTNAKS